MKAASEFGEDRSEKINLIIIGCMIYNHELSTKEPKFVEEA